MPINPRRGPRRVRPTVDVLVAGVLRGDRPLLAQAITLVESTRPSDEAAASELLGRLMPHTGGSWRVGITGVPGVGKSTFIEALGSQLTGAGRRVAVLAVDPSSTRTGGSILGDKTRMAALATDPRAFVRPSPTAGTLGGVASRTRESLLLLEAAGFDVVLVETVGVGQSETVVKDMVDSFVVLMIAGAGDELQGIKRGVIELADLLVVNKADGDNTRRARAAAADLRSAVRLLHPSETVWVPPVRTCSSLTGDGLVGVWEQVGDHRAAMLGSGRFGVNRERQLLAWMWQLVEDQLGHALRRHPAVAAQLAALEDEVRAGTIPPTTAARGLVRTFLGDG
ncbi:MAG: LAO/AO transport system kinase [Myxococcota bacterium]|jgi:LAO/AO transport system kinase